MTKTPWTDNNYEGKALRRVLAKLIKRFEKLDKEGNADEEKLMKLAHTISMIANSKGALAKEETGILRKIKELEQRLPPKLKPGTILDGVQDTCKDILRFSN